MKQPSESLIEQCEHNTFETPWNKLQNLLGMKLTTDVTLLFLSVADSDIFVYFFMSQIWTMHLTESMNASHFSDRFVHCPYLVNGLQSKKKDLLLDKFSI